MFCDFIDLVRATQEDSTQEPTHTLAQQFVLRFEAPWLDTYENTAIIVDLLDHMDGDVTVYIEEDKLFNQSMSQTDGAFELEFSDGSKAELIFKDMNIYAQLIPSYHYWLN